MGSEHSTLQFELPAEEKPSSTARRRAGLDVAARSAATVRSEAEDERRSREQSLRAHQSSKLLTRFDVGSRWTKWKWALDWSACPCCDL
jgi:hypothetical protein